MLGMHVCYPKLLLYTHLLKLSKCSKEVQLGSRSYAVTRRGLQPSSSALSYYNQANTMMISISWQSLELAPWNAILPTTGNDSQLHPVPSHYHLISYPILSPPVVSTPAQASLIPAFHSFLINLFFNPFPELIFKSINLILAFFNLKILQWLSKIQMSQSSTKTS